MVSGEGRGKGRGEQRTGEHGEGCRHRRGDLAGVVQPEEDGGGDHPDGPRDDDDGRHAQGGLEQQGRPSLPAAGAQHEEHLQAVPLPGDVVGEPRQEGCEGDETRTAEGDERGPAERLGVELGAPRAARRW